MPNSVPVVCRPQPFSPKVIRDVVAEGASILETVTREAIILRVLSEN
jgi:hypothetical protein